MKLLPETRLRRRGLACVVVTLVVVAAGFVGWMVRMPGSSHLGPLPPLTEEQAVTRERLRVSVETLCVEIGQRHDRRPPTLLAAAELIESELSRIGYEAERQPYRVDGVEVFNVEARAAGCVPGLGCLVLGAHYDTVSGTPGADDNASGVAGLIELARLLREQALRHDVRFVFYANEEPPRFRTDAMGSRVHALRLVRAGVSVAAMISLESLGYYSSAAGSQHYPAPFGAFYPDRGDFVAFVGNLRSRALVHRCVGSFRELARFPSEGLSAPASIPGVGWSDHASYWEQGFPAVMVTDTAPFRNPHYHRSTDTPGTLDFGALARVVHGLLGVVVELDRAIE